MEYGGLSVTDMRSGTPGMPLQCAGSFATSMKVRTLNGQTSFLFFSGSGLFYSLHPLSIISLGRGCWERGYYFTL